MNSKKTKASFIAGLVALIPLFSPVTANAQGTDNNAGAIEEIIVTAQKRAQNLQDVPLTVSVLSGEAMDKLNMDNMQDIADHIPGLLIQGSSNSKLGKL